MINIKDIDVELCKQEFVKNRRIVIDNFLVEDWAEKLYNYYTIEMNKEYWCATYMPSLKYEGDWEWWKILHIIDIVWNRHISILVLLETIIDSVIFSSKQFQL